MSSKLPESLRRLVQSVPQNQDEHSVDVRRTILTLAGFLLIPLLLAAFATASATALMWALACFVSGAAVGFLYGLPRVLQGNQIPNTQSVTVSYQQLVSTKVEEIADWLTKIIVGLGLVELRSIPPFVKRVASYLAHCIGPGDCALAISVALVVYFVVLGLLSGYVLTRLFLAPALGRADTEANERRAVRQEVDDLRSSVEILKESIPSTPPGAPPLGLQEQSDALSQLIQEYENANNIKDETERVTKKTEVASQMRNYAAGADRDALANRNEEGAAVALASITWRKHEPGDIERLLKAARNARRTFARIQVTRALREAINAGLGSASLRERIEAVLKQFASDDANRSLATEIEGTLAVLGNRFPK
jgi:hypothetical protein